VAATSDAELAAAKEQLDKDMIERDRKGRFRKGAPLPHPKGRGAGRKRFSDAGSG
jgi:hypothetical protein